MFVEGQAMVGRYERAEVGAVPQPAAAHAMQLTDRLRQLEAAQALGLQMAHLQDHLQQVTPSKSGA